jgi:hypothetical protein
LNVPVIFLRCCGRFRADDPIGSSTCPWTWPRIRVLSSVAARSETPGDAGPVTSSHRRCVERVVWAETSGMQGRSLPRATHSRLLDAPSSGSISTEDVSRTCRELMVRHGYPVQQAGSGPGPRQPATQRLEVKPREAAARWPRGRPPVQGQCATMLTCSTPGPSASAGM